MEEHGRYDNDVYKSRIMAMPFFRIVLSYSKI